MQYNAVNSSNIYINKNLSAFGSWDWTVDFYMKKLDDNDVTWVLFNPTYTYHNYIDEYKYYYGHYIKL